MAADAASLSALRLRHWLRAVGPLPLPRRVTSGNACRGRDPGGRPGSSGGQFGKLSPYLFLIKKMNDSHGCQLTRSHDLNCDRVVLHRLYLGACIKKKKKIKRGSRLNAKLNSTRRTGQEFTSDNVCGRCQYKSLIPPLVRVHLVDMCAFCLMIPNSLQPGPV